MPRYARCEVLATQVRRVENIFEKHRKGETMRCLGCLLGFQGGEKSVREVIEVTLDEDNGRTLVS